MRGKFIVCGPQGPLPGKLALCSKCGAEIWPTDGTLVRSLVDDIPLICMDCFTKVGEYEFGGVMHHGEYLPSSIAKKFYEFIEEWKKGKGE